MNLSLNLYRLVASSRQNPQDMSNLAALGSYQAIPWPLITNNLTPAEMAPLLATGAGWTTVLSPLLKGQIGNFGIFRSTGERLAFRVIGAEVRFQGSYQPTGSPIQAVANEPLWPFLRVPSAVLYGRQGTALLNVASEEIGSIGGQFVIKSQTVPISGAARGGLTAFFSPFNDAASPLLAVTPSVGAPMVQNGVTIDNLTAAAGPFSTSRVVSMNTYLDLDVSFSPQSNGNPEDLFIVMPIRLENAADVNANMLDYDLLNDPQSFAGDELVSSARCLVCRYSTNSSSLTAGSAGETADLISPGRTTATPNFFVFGSAGPYSFSPPIA